VLDPVVKRDTELVLRCRGEESQFTVGPSWAKIAEFGQTKQVVVVKVS
jgi:hypothetical protein